MTHRALMVLKMKPEDAERVAALFAEHDSKTNLPGEIGVTRRMLFRFQDLYMHLIESDHDIMGNLYRARESPAFQEINEELAKYLTRYTSDWTEIKDSRAEMFYDWRAGEGVIVGGDQAASE